jgi:3',5'-cyclic AMP phosphodiesterase CpdA
MRIQYASDLHLELGSGPPRLFPVAPVLVLAGDIGNPCQPAYRDFLRDCARAWEHVVVVAGNHEFYNKHASERWRYKAPDTVAERLAACRAAAAAAGANVHFLERERVNIGDLAFLGCTLWSDVSGSEDLVESRMSDYHVICAEGGGNRKLRAADTLAWHQRDRAWLTQELAACREEGRGAVVVTHHLPTFDLISSRWVGHPLNAGFATALDELIQEPVRAWICGHSHTGSIVFKGSIPCVLNPRGYPGETASGFCGDIFVDVATGAGPGADEREPALVAAAETPTPDVSGSGPSPQRPAAPSQSSETAETLSDDDSESDT